MSEPILPKGWYGQPVQVLVAHSSFAVRHLALLDTNERGVLVETDYHWQRFYPWSVIESIEPVNAGVDQ